TSTATVAVTINAVNDNPTTAGESATTDEDTPVTVDVLANDSDVEGDTLSVDSATAPNGTVAINPDGTITYTPDPNFTGSDTITYTVSDGNGGTATATVAVTINAVNDNPTTAGESATTDEDTPVTVDVLANDSDVDGDTLTVDSASAANGTVAINPDGTITYTPNANFTGSDTIT
ncbi:cadherin-like domain-containing protein, partial [Neptunomonas phycophila]